MYQPITGTGNGTAPVVNLTWPFLDQDHVLATIGGVPASLLWTGPAQVTFGAAVTAGVAWEVSRKTPTDPLVDFTDGSVLTEADLDLAHRQHQYIEEELRYNLDNTPSLGGLAETIRDTVAATLIGGPNVTITPNDGADTITISAAGGGGGGGGSLGDGDYGDVAISGGAMVFTVQSLGAVPFGYFATGTDAANLTGTVALARLPAIADGSFLGNISGGAASPAVLTGAQVTSHLSVFSDTDQGVVPASGGGTVKFLRADGSWASPPANGSYQVQSIASAATVTPTFSDDQVNITAQAVNLTLANPTGTATERGLVIRIKDNGTSRTITYGTQYRAIGETLPTATVPGKVLYLGLLYNAAAAKWDVIAVAQET